MKAELSWDDLALFAAVARAGALAPAAEATGASPATLSRRMKRLETQLGRRLFAHGPSGYTPTAEGRALLALAKRMEAAAAEVGHWCDGRRGPPRVRISAGTWTAAYLAQHLPSYWRAGASWMPEFVHSDRDLDIERREIDIGIRNRRPSHPWLAGRKTATIPYAAYAVDEGVRGWIGPSEGAAYLPSEAWTLAEHGAEISGVANSPQVRLSLAEAGVGRVVLPCFIGDARERLSRVSAPIAALETEEWLVCHHETRHDPAIRAALEAMAGFLTRPRPLPPPALPLTFGGR